MQPEIDVNFNISHSIAYSMSELTRDQTLAYLEQLIWIRRSLEAMNIPKSIHFHTDFSMFDLIGEPKNNQAALMLLKEY